MRPEEALTFDSGERKRWKLDQNKGFISLFNMSQKIFFVACETFWQRLFTSWYNNKSSVEHHFWVQ